MVRARRSSDRARLAGRMHDRRRKSPLGGEDGPANAKYVDQQEEQNPASRQIREITGSTRRSQPGIEKVNDGYDG